MFENKEEAKEKDIEIKYVTLEDAEIFASASEALEAKRAKRTRISYKLAKV
ncbi:hypothetical protein ABEZ87_10225 [Bacillus mycoides]|uniref:hypothetical protein n=1 Tax=Bacillus mycoides TaxID=1405 RepID=UPI003D24D5D1